MSGALTCWRCNQEIKNAPTIHYLGLAVSLVAGVVEFSTNKDLIPLRPKPLELLYAIIIGGSRGATVSSLYTLVKGPGNAVAVHLTAIRHWLKDNCLPLAIVYNKTNRAYVLVEIPST